MENTMNHCIAKQVFSCLAALSLALPNVTCGGGGEKGKGLSDLAHVVHTVGYEMNEWSIMVAMYWKNKETTRLSGGATDALAHSVYAFGSDAYASGYEYSSQGQPVATLWKNGKVEKTFSSKAGSGPASPHNTHEARSVFVAGNGDVYAAVNETYFDPELDEGYYRLDDRVGRIYKNGEVIFSITGGSIYSVFVLGNDVYYGGILREYSSSIGAYQNVGKVWKNGTLLYDMNPDTVIFSVAVALDGKVYAAGFENRTQAWPGFENYSAGKRVARLWVNGAAQNLGAGTGPSSASTVHVSGSDVCAVLWEFTTSAPDWMSQARYWKNGTLHTLGSSDTSTEALGIFGQNGNVYAVGGERDQAKGFRVAKYWVNGEAYTISSGNFDALAYDIFVK
jgi:hypothetical protein